MKKAGIFLLAVSALDSVEAHSTGHQLIVNGNFAQSNCETSWCIFNDYDCLDCIKGWNPKPQIEIGFGEVYNSNLGKERVIELAPNFNSCIEQSVKNLLPGIYQLKYEYATREERSPQDSQFKVKFNDKQLNDIIPSDNKVNTDVIEFEVKQGCDGRVEFCGFGGQNNSYGAIIRTVSLVRKEDLPIVKPSQPPVVNPQFTQQSVANPQISHSPLMNPQFTQPSVANPQFTQQSVANPQISHSPLMNPQFTQPSVANPQFTQPSVANPQISHSPLMNPQFTQPSVANPQFTQPSVANPQISHSPLMNPQFTQPSVANPQFTQPSVANPLISQSSLMNPQFTQPPVVNPLNHPNSVFNNGNFELNNFPFQQKRPFINQMPVIGNYQFGEPGNVGSVNFQQGSIGGSIQSFQSGNSGIRHPEQQQNTGNIPFNQPSPYRFNGNDPSRITLESHSGKCLERQFQLGAGKVEISFVYSISSSTKALFALKESALFVTLNGKPIYKVLPDDDGNTIKIQGNVKQGSNIIGFCTIGSPKEHPHQVYVANIVIKQKQCATKWSNDLIINGGFQQNQCGSDTCIWNRSNGIGKVPGWEPSPEIEVGRGAIYNSALGQSWVTELDPNSNSCIRQKLILNPGKYSLKFDWALRWGLESPSYQFEVKLNGNVLRSLNETNDRRVVQEQIEFELKECPTESWIEFCATGTSDAQAAMIDNVKLFRQDRC